MAICWNRWSRTGTFPRVIYWVAPGTVIASSDVKWVGPAPGLVWTRMQTTEELWERASTCATIFLGQGVPTLGIVSISCDRTVSMFENKVCGAPYDGPPCGACSTCTHYNNTCSLLSCSFSNCLPWTGIVNGLDSGWQLLSKISRTLVSQGRVNIKLKLNENNNRHFYVAHITFSPKTTKDFPWKYVRKSHYILKCIRFLTLKKFKKLTLSFVNFSL